MTNVVFLICCVTILVGSVANTHAQVKQTVLYSFGASETDGASSFGRLAVDSAGNFYGVTVGGGLTGFGTAYELSFTNGQWNETTIYNFCVMGFPNCQDGRAPAYGMILDAGRNLYGSTPVGGTGTHCPGQNTGCGVVFELSPPAVQGDPWTETILWDFGTFAGDGCGPSGLMWDASGNLYGTSGCGLHGGGTVFELSPPTLPGGEWTKNTLYNFCSGGYPCIDGSNPIDGVIFDDAGNLYGATFKGGSFNGVVYQLAPPQSGTEWVQTVLYTFTSKTGGHPHAGLTIDTAGNVYGTVSDGGVHGAGATFRLKQKPGGGWIGQAIPFSGFTGRPISALLIYGGALYGTTTGTVFQIKGTKEVVVYTFCQLPGCADGQIPSGAVIQKDGKLYGVTNSGGDHGNGVVYELSR